MPASIDVALIVNAANGALAAAHARLLRDPSFQFAFERPPRLNRPPPRWLLELLRAVGRPLAWLAPYLGWLVWGALGLGVIAIAALVVFEVIRGRRRGTTRTVLAKARHGADEWRPDPARARVLLSDADALAQAGRYDEAARLILRRSIADIVQRRPELVEVSHTSRDIAALGGVPAAARAAFAPIVAAVEASAFALEAMDAEGWAACRAAYADFALPSSWALTGTPAGAPARALA